MQSTRVLATPNGKALPYAIAFLLTVVAVQSGFILMLDAGHFVSTLDNPYIHLALAQNIREGLCGITLSGNAAPSSSILWPLPLAPFPSLA